jgi:uncharacterized protein YjbI with pentapeptide repeats
MTDKEKVFEYLREGSIGELDLEGADLIGANLSKAD